MVLLRFKTSSSSLTDVSVVSVVPVVRFCSCYNGFTAVIETRTYTNTKSFVLIDRQWH